MNDNTSLDILPGNWARLKLVPLARGELNIYCKYPTGSTDLLLTNYVEKGRSNKTCYQAGLEGDYEVWYTVDRANSNFVLLHVIGGLVKKRAKAAPSKGYFGSAPSSGSSYYASSSPAIGLSPGGAKDINSFRDNIRNDYLPLPTDTTYELLLLLLRHRPGPGMQEVLQSIQQGSYIPYRLEL
jgi:hypothetical protein